MKRFTVPILNILLAIGIVCIFAGFFLLIHPFAGLQDVAPFTNICLILFGALCFYFALVKYRHAPLFFFGLYLCLASCLFLLVTSGILPVGLSQLWPCGVVLCGICLFFTGLFRHRKILSAYLFPSLLLIILGGFFLLFSLDIISISFRTFVARWWPVFLIIIGLFLVGLFLYQQNPQFYFPYEPEADDSELEVREE
ncbi:MAG: hypothetical protein IJP62_01515 [Treponema sp.]|nr:hypothetical protein [Treponema sp.]